MLFKTNKYKNLIIKVLQGEASPEEQRIARAWVDKDPQNKRVYESYEALLLLTHSKKVNYDTDKAWEKIQSRIKNTTSRPVPKKSILAGKRKTIIRYAAVSGIAALLVLAIAIFPLLKSQPRMLQITSGLSQNDTQLLPDGTSVSLNAGSVINYPERFTGDFREISIFGEAFFEVSRDAERPFVIHAEGLEIKVIGTSFNIEAYPGSDYVKVTVSTGKVLVYPSGADAETSGCYLTAGEMATFSKESAVILKGTNDNLNFLSWKTGILTFREARLADVFKALESKYKTRFTAENQEVLNQRLTARFENETIEEVLETLSLIFNVKFEKKENEIILLP